MVRAAIALLLLALGPSIAHAQKRVALVIGNSAYEHTPKLANPKNDAIDVAAALKTAGLQVMEAFDLDKAAFDRKIREFATALSGADAGIFFYAGHGLQVAGRNYLVPIDAKLEDAAGLDFEMVQLDLVHRTMERQTSTNILFLDACRNNPLARNLARAMGTRSSEVGRGLAPVESGVGTLISFSTQPGNVALDGTGRNSPFAGSLGKRISASNDDLSALLIDVRNDVRKETANKQIPWEHSALTGRFYFTPPKPLGPSPEQQMELAFWASVKDNRSPAVLKSYLERYPDGVFAPAARALIEQHQIDAGRAAREEQRRREQETTNAAELKRLDEERKARETALLEERRHAEEVEQRLQSERLKDQQRADARLRAEELRKAQEAAAAEAARLAAIKAAEDARKAVEAAPPTPAEVTARPDRLAALPQVSEPPPKPEADSALLANKLQSELKRVGCDPGVLDGRWGVTAKQALGEFARSTQLQVAIEEPTEVALQAVTQHKGRACAPTCRAGETLLKGKCVASTPTEPRKARAVEKRPVAEAAPGQVKSKTKLCAAMGGINLPPTMRIPCDSPYARRD